MPINRIGNLLGATDELKALSARARRVLQLQALYAVSAPRELAGASRVRNFRAGTLFVSADNAAVAAKLKQLAPSVLASMRKIEAEITGIHFEVQVSGRLRDRRPQSKKTALGSDAVQKFDELAKRVPDGDLKSALARLVRRRRSAKGG